MQVLLLRGLSLPALRWVKTLLYKCRGVRPAEEFSTGSNKLSCLLVRQVVVIYLGGQLLSVHNCQLGIIRSKPSGVVWAFELVLEAMETCSLPYLTPNKP